MATNVNNLGRVLQAQGDLAAVTLNYGRFIQTVFDFVIVALAIFLAIRGMNNLRRKEEAPPAPPAPPEPTGEEKLLTEIRDLLKEK